MHISISLAALITLASAAVIPDPELDRRQEDAVITWRDCTWEKGLLEADLDEMQALARKAAEHVDTTPELFRAFFGQEPPRTNIRDSTIKKRYTAVSNFKSKPKKSVTIRCNTDSIPACKPANHVVAADKGGPNIYICNSYWHTRKDALLRKMSPSRHPLRYGPLDEYIPIGSQLMHELTHVWFITEDHNITNPASGQIENVYGHRNSLLLARESAQKARENADNYKMFAIASYFDSSHWSVDPDRLSGDPEL
ncbi:zincin [Choiromyces venosus 120613-1]|uniref:Zincin n=1 Tax=Choiromyces venosus 120613-1 TaxID=1336337 RepID=A0A3N4JHS0_9PEZI|nr:zincin [Choiromyces venosus 120613-1]